MSELAQHPDTVTTAAGPRPPILPRPAPSATPAPYLALGLLALIWGASFLFIKLAIQDMSPAALVLIRALSAVATLWVILLATGRAPSLRDLKGRTLNFLVMGLFGSLIPWYLFNWSEIYISSGLASIFNATTPLWTAIFAIWVTPNERPGRINFVGVGLGLAGTLVLFAPDLIRSGANPATIGSGAALLASAVYAAGALFQRRRMDGIDPFKAAFWQMAMTALVGLPLALPTIASVRLEPLGLAAALVLGVIGSGLAYILYYYLLNTLGGTRATTVTFLLPVTAVFWGVVLLHERLTVPILVGMAVILAGVALVSLPSRKRATGAAAR